MSNEHKEIREEVSLTADDLKEMIASGFDNFLSDVSGFVDDVSTLVDSINNLYDDKKKQLMLAGVRVEVHVYSEALKKPMLDAAIGVKKKEQVND